MLTFRKMITSYFWPITKGKGAEKKSAEEDSQQENSDELQVETGEDFEAFRGLATTLVQITLILPFSGEV